MQRSLAWGGALCGSELFCTHFGRKRQTLNQMTSAPGLKLLLGCLIMLGTLGKRAGVVIHQDRGVETDAGSDITPQPLRPLVTSVHHRVLPSKMVYLE
eukprot:1146035-Pelagomonas_calceolata.AAC.2